MVPGTSSFSPIQRMLGCSKAADQEPSFKPLYTTEGMTCFMKLVLLSSFCLEFLNHILINVRIGLC